MRGVERAEAQDALAGAGVEGFGGQRGVDELLQVRLDARQQLPPTRREHQATPLPHEEGGAHGRVQPPERCTDSWLRQVELGGRLGDAAGGRDDREHTEQVEVQITSISAAHVLYTSYSLE